MARKKRRGPSRDKRGHEKLYARSRVGKKALLQPPPPEAPRDPEEEEIFERE